MNSFHPKKLLNSKWTAVTPVNKEKHFVVVDVNTDDDGNVLACELEAIMTMSTRNIDWVALKNCEVWQQGWV